MGFKPTIEQEMIINHDIDNVLVSAAAGSGKTTVLVNRIIDKIISNNMSLDSILVVTFTNDAANHMQEKIEKAIRERIILEKNNGNIEMAKKLSAQLDLLPNSYIQTLDSFCTRVIKEKGYVIAGDDKSDLFDTGNVILDENQLKLILNQAAALAIADSYKDAKPGSAFIKLTERFGDGRTDDSLATCLVECYKKLRSIPHYIETVNNALNGRKILDIAGKLKYWDNFIEDIDDLFLRITPEYLSDLKNAFISCGAYPGTKSKLKKNDDIEKKTEEWFEAPEELFENIIEARKISEEEYLKAILDCDDFVGQSFGKITEPDILSIASQFCAAVCFFKRLKGQNAPGGYGANSGIYSLPNEYVMPFLMDRETMLNYQIEGTYVCEAFVKLIELTDMYFAELKMNFHGMDFADQEYAAFDILCMPDAANFYKNKFTEIYVDEYQDNTALQDAIIASFAKNNVFRVGDIKQSIYGFRAANPQIFNRLSENLDCGKVDGKLFLLTQNHRSSAEILDFINFVFGQIMKKETTTVEYDSKHRLNTPEVPSHGPIPDVLIVDKSKINVEDKEEEADIPEEDGSYDSGSSLNSQALAYGVLYKVSEYLKEEDTSYKDICILTRTVNKASKIASVLNSYGYPTACINKTSIFVDQDIHGILNLLVVLGNEYRSEYLLSVLLSGYRFSNFTLTEISEITRYISKNHNGILKDEFITKLRVFAKEVDDELGIRVNSFLDYFDNLKLTVKNTDIDDVVEKLYRDTGIRATLRKNKKDDSKLTLLKDWLSAGFKRFGSDISGISSELERMKIQINSKANFEIKDADKNKITAMNVHKSKGLEFKYVIFALDDGKEGGDKVSSIFFDREDGFVTDNYSSNPIMRMESFEQMMYKRKLKLDNNAETMRLLYVALTRAMNKLSIVTCSDMSENGKPEKFLVDTVKNASFEENSFFRKNHWLLGNSKMGYQLFGALSRASAAQKIRYAAGVSDEDFKCLIEYKGFTCELLNPKEIGDIDKNPNSETTSKTDVDEHNYDDFGLFKADEYKYQEQVSIPFKVSVTGISDGKVSESTHVDLMVKPVEDFTDKAYGKISSSMKGTIAHLILRFIDLDKLANDPSCGEELVNNLLDYGVFGGYQKEDILEVYREFADGICYFAASEIGQELIEADLKMLSEFEKPIVFSVPVSEEKDFALVQGIIDALYESDEGVTIIDYKTDNYGDITEEEIINKAKEKHTFQINCYAGALEASGKKIKAKYLYLLRYKIFVEIK